jgi:hypothetical protein
LAVFGIALGPNVVVFVAWAIMIEKLGRAATHHNIYNGSDIKGHMPDELIVEVQIEHVYGWVQYVVSK